MFKVYKNPTCGFLRKLLIAALAAMIVAPRSGFAFPFNPADWQMSGDAQMTSDGTFILLTQDAPGRAGKIVYRPGICAKEYRITYDVYFGTTTSANGGSGIKTFAYNSNSANEYRAHADTFYDAAEDSRFELNDNHVSLESLGAAYDLFGRPPSSGNTTFGPLAAGTVPFKMKGAGWVTSEFYKKGNLLKITMSNGTSGLVLQSQTAFYSPGTLLFPGFEAATGPAHNEHRVRNIEIQVLDSSDCPGYLPPLTLEEARAQIVTACGDVTQCPDRATYTACVDATLAGLEGQGRITADVADLLQLEAQYALSFCDGYQQCITVINPAQLEANAYQEGFTAGVASVNLDANVAAARQAGYEEGFAAGSAQGRELGIQEGYASGYSAGHDAGYSEGSSAGYSAGYSAGQSEGYQAGFNDGSASGYASGHTDGYQEGLAAGYDNGYAAGYEQGREDGVGSAPSCTMEQLIEDRREAIERACGRGQFRNRGQFVACVNRYMKDHNWNSDLWAGIKVIFLNDADGKWGEEQTRRGYRRKVS